MKHLRIVAAALLTALLAAGCTTGNSSDHPYTAKKQGQQAPAKAKKTKSAAQKAFDNLTGPQKQAIGAAQDYLGSQAFSQKGLIAQLSSSYGSGFNKKDAIFAVNHIKVDWNAEAVKAAKQYLSTQHFSCSGLIGQLSSSYGSQFTPAQARYGAHKAGVC